MPIWNRVCIVGTGLIGGSVGLAIRDAELADERVGFDVDEKRLKGALRKRAIDVAAESIAEAARDADLIVLCVPVQHVVKSLNIAVPVASKTALLLDVGSTKRTICEQIEEKRFANRFVGCHPMAGSEQAGPERSQAGLFDDKKVIISSLPSSGAEYVALARHLWMSIGASTIDMSPVDHDELMAQVSHLPHMLASALASSTDPHAVPFCGTGWADSTRIASGDPDLWQQIVLENRLPLLQTMENFATIWDDWIKAVESNDPNQIHKMLMAGKNIRDLVANRNPSR